MFVFDGPNKPPFKRNKRTGPNVASIPEFLAKQLLKQFGLPIHLAPGEAEAECALLQQRKIVDAVLSEDVDTLMFGSTVSLRNWTSEGTTVKTTPTHVNLYDAVKTKSGKSGLDREGMILVALMSGGDYIPEGIPRCGPKTACEAARAGFGAELCTLTRKDKTEIARWKERLAHELKTNESKLFSRKHITLSIPDDFPRMDILRYYTHPVISPDDKVDKLYEDYVWDCDIDIVALRSFTLEAFNWVCISGARHFVRNLAPAMLVKQLRLRAGVDQNIDDTEKIAEDESKLVKSIFGARKHSKTDETPELRVGFVPLDLVNINLNLEEPDPEIPIDISDAEEDEAIPEGATTQVQKRTAVPFDPSRLERAWVLETFIKVGVPLCVQDWQNTIRSNQQREALKASRKDKAQARNKGTGGMPVGALDQYAKISKPGSIFRREISKGKSSDLASEMVIREVDVLQEMRAGSRNETVGSIPLIEMSDSDFRAPRQVFIPTKHATTEIVSLLSSPDGAERPCKRVFSRTQSDTSAITGARLHASTIRKPVEVPFVRSRSSQMSPETTQISPRSEERPDTAPIFRLPVERTMLKPFVSQSGFRPPREVALPQIIKEALQEPRTPTKSIKRRFRSASQSPAKIQRPVPTPEVIDILSSPQTPRSSQRSIRDFLDSPSRKSPSSSPLCTFRNVTSRVNRSNSQEQATEMSSPESRASSRSREAAASKQHENRQKTIRLRQSLAGAWAAALPNSQTSVEAEKASQVRSWRMSQVEVLDLT